MSFDAIVPNSEGCLELYVATVAYVVARAIDERPPTDCNIVAASNAVHLCNAQKGEGETLFVARIAVRQTFYACRYHGDMALRLIGYEQELNGSH